MARFLRRAFSFLRHRTWQPLTFLYLSDTDQWVPVSSLRLIQRIGISTNEYRGSSGFGGVAVILMGNCFYMWDMRLFYLAMKR